MKLRIEDLKVESFETEVNKRAIKGTVKGYDWEEKCPTMPVTCEIKPSYYDTCHFTCLENCTERCTL